MSVLTHATTCLDEFELNFYLSSFELTSSNLDIRNGTVYMWWFPLCVCERVVRMSVNIILERLGEGATIMFQDVTQAFSRDKS
jgi:hypothetical protein